MEKGQPAHISGAPASGCDAPLAPALVQQPLQAVQFPLSSTTARETSYESVTSTTKAAVIGCQSVVAAFDQSSAEPNAKREVLGMSSAENQQGAAAGKKGDGDQLQEFRPWF